MCAHEEGVQGVQTVSKTLQAHRTCALLLLTVLSVLLASGARSLAQDGRRGLDTIEHIVVIYAEDRSFDNLFGAIAPRSGARLLRIEMTNFPPSGNAT